MNVTTPDLQLVFTQPLVVRLLQHSKANGLSEDQVSLRTILDVLGLKAALSASSLITSEPHRTALRSYAIGAVCPAGPLFVDPRSMSALNMFTTGISVGEGRTRLAYFKAANELAHEALECVQRLIALDQHVGMTNVCQGPVFAAQAVVDVLADRLPDVVDNVEQALASVAQQRTGAMAPATYLEFCRTQLITLIEVVQENA